MSDALELHGRLEFEDGRVIRFAPDETDVENLLMNLRFDTQMPGGYADGSIELPRPPELEADDARLFSRFAVEIPGGDDVYVGEIVGTPQVGEFIQLDLAGPITRLDDDKTYRRLWIDRNLSRWGEPSLQRRINLVSAGNSGRLSGNVQAGYASSGGAAMGLVVSFDRVDAVSGTRYDLAEPWYYANGLPIGRIRYDFDHVSGMGAGWSNTAFLSTDDLSSSFNTGSDHGQTDATDQTVAASGAAKKYALLRSLYGGTFTVDVKTEAQWRNIRIHGTDLPTLQGTAPNEGFYPHDLIAEMLSGAGLDYSIGDSIEESSMLIMQAAFLEETTRREIIEILTAQGSPPPFLNDWGWYDGEFFWRTPGTYGRTWVVRRDEVATPQSDGPDSSKRISGVVVKWRDGAGREQRVGPPGSGADTETTDLLDSDPNNPAHRRTRKWEVVDAGIVPNAAAATLIGQTILTEYNRIVWRGKINIQGWVTDTAGQRHHPAKMRAGDRVVIEDDVEGIEHPVVATTYDDSSKSVSASIGAPPETLPALMGQLEMARELAGL